MFRMKLRSALRRLAVTLPFFAVAAVIMGLFSDPLSPGRPNPDGLSPLILIVTTESLHPAFKALDDWNRAHGCSSRLITLDGKRIPKSESGLMTRIGALCREQGVTGLLLGGDRRHVPLMHGRGRGQFNPETKTGMPQVVPIPTPPGVVMPAGLVVGRAPVRSLEEAWTFVNACRESGQTLDILIEGGRSLDVAEAVFPYLESELFPAVSATATLRMARVSPRPIR
jgi:hypothetical protein